MQVNRINPVMPKFKSVSFGENTSDEINELEKQQLQTLKRLNQHDKARVIYPLGVGATAVTAAALAAVMTPSVTYQTEEGEKLPADQKAAVSQYFPEKVGFDMKPKENAPDVKVEKVGENAYFLTAPNTDLFVKQNETKFEIRGSVDDIQVNARVSDNRGSKAKLPLQLGILGGLLMGIAAYNKTHPLLEDKDRETIKKLEAKHGTQKDEEPKKSDNNIDDEPDYDWL